MTQESTQGAAQSPLGRHGAKRLPSVLVTSYNIELKDKKGFVGDRASKGAFREIIDGLRKSLRRNGDDPIGDEPTDELTKSELDRLLTSGDAEAAGLLHTAVEDFSRELASIIRRFQKQTEWSRVERIAVGGGMQASRLGKLVAGRTSVMLRTEKQSVELVSIHNDPDEAGLIGAVHLAPQWIFKSFDGIIGVDIGGTNIRAGVIDLNLKRAPNLAKAKVWKLSSWRYGDEEGVKRIDAVEYLAKMIRALISTVEKKRKGMKLAPFIGVGCPGLIEEDGSISRGTQNLPGNWETKRFNLPLALRDLVPEIQGSKPSIMLHNDAVVQGLSEIPYMQDVKGWAILTIGTGLGNATFVNGPDADSK
ncbi:MAG TPA: ROK family protein [Xanthobacteraceae bacterium]|nr:ROK family protein [Xanthobacteraceae bacterium]